MCMGRDNLGTATVNNYGVQSPPPRVRLVSDKPWNGATVDDPIPRLGLEVAWTIDNSFTGPIFYVLCNRPCKPIAGGGGGGGISSASVMSAQDNPNVALMVITIPTTIHTDDKITMYIKSMDSQPITVRGVGTCTLSKDGKGYSCGPASR